MYSNKVYFYPHKYLRDRHLDTIRGWNKKNVINPELANKKGDQVSKVSALRTNIKWNWKKKIPLLNIKFRPNKAPTNSIIYSWGALIATGKFIIDIDNPYSITGYNINSFKYYKLIIRLILLSNRCIAIHCLSYACKKSLGNLLGKKVYEKSIVKYPKLKINPELKKLNKQEKIVRFLYISTQFHIKGGLALIKAFKEVYRKNNKCTLDMITYLPNNLIDVVKKCEGITIYEPGISREKIFKDFMMHSDVLIHPTYMDSFGMVILEAMSHGMAIIATDVYAIREMVKNNFNGYLLDPPISKWNGTKPRDFYNNEKKFLNLILNLDITKFSKKLEESIYNIVKRPRLLIEFKRNSSNLFSSKFK